MGAFSLAYVVVLGAFGLAPFALPVMLAGIAMLG